MSPVPEDLVGQREKRSILENDRRTQLRGAGGAFSAHVCA